MKLVKLLPALLLVGTAAQADVTVTTQTVGKASIIDVSGESVNMING